MNLKPETHALYVKISNSIEKELLQPPVGFLDIGGLNEELTRAYFDRIKNKFKELSLATARLYRCALLSVYQHCYNNELLIELLSKLEITKDTTKEKGANKKTSSNRTKEISERDIERLLEYQNKDKSAWRKLSIDFILMSLITGMRSIEWTQCSLVKTNENNDENKNIFIKIENAKYRDGKDGGVCVAFSKYRHFPLQKLLEEDQVNDIKKIADLILKYSKGQINAYGEVIVLDPVSKKEITKKKFLNRLRIEVSHINNTIFGKNGRRITLHSARHQFVANLKKHPHSDPIYCAIMMGHFSPESAQRYYARKKVGRSKVGPLPDPHPEDIKQFFDAHKNNALVSNKDRTKYKQPTIQKPGASSKSSFSPR